MVLIGIFNLVNFGMYVAMNAITPVWIQKPVKAGGYAFTSRENALCKSLSYLQEDPRTNS